MSVHLNGPERNFVWDNKWNSVAIKKTTRQPSPFPEHNFNHCCSRNAEAFVRSVTASGGPGTGRKSRNASRPGRNRPRSFGKLLVTRGRRQENTGKDILSASFLQVITRGHFCNKWPVGLGTAPDGQRQIPGPFVANFSSTRGQKDKKKRKEWTKTPKEWPR